MELAPTPMFKSKKQIELEDDNVNLKFLLTTNTLNNKFAPTKVKLTLRVGRSLILDFSTFRLSGAKPSF